MSIEDPCCAGQFEAKNKLGQRVFPLELAQQENYAEFAPEGEKVVARVQRCESADPVPTLTPTPPTPPTPTPRASPASR